MEPQCHPERHVVEGSEEVGEREHLARTIRHSAGYLISDERDWLATSQPERTERLRSPSESRQSAVDSRKYSFFPEYFEQVI